MRLSPSRLSALALWAAIGLTPAVVLGVAPVLAAGSGNGITLSPPVVEHVAKVGTVGSVTVANGTGNAMNVSVVVRPWVQSAGGAAQANQRAVIASVRPSAASFALANNASRVVSLSLAKAPSAGSLYGAIDVTALPSKPSHKHNAVTLEYRIVGSLRLDPQHPSYGARVGGVVVNGNAGKGTLELAVTNTGNTIAPTGGTVYVRGPRGGANGSFSSVVIVPGQTVDVPVLGLDGSLPAGSYTLSGTLVEAGRHVLNVNKTFTLR